MAFGGYGDGWVGAEASFSSLSPSLAKIELVCLALALALLAGNLLAALPAAVAARTRPGVSLRTE